MQVTAGVCLFYSLNISFGRLGPITSAPNDRASPCRSDERRVLPATSVARARRFSDRFRRDMFSRLLFPIRRKVGCLHFEAG